MKENPTTNLLDLFEDEKNTVVEPVDVNYWDF